MLHSSIARLLYYQRRRPRPPLVGRERNLEVHGAELAVNVFIRVVSLGICIPPFQSLRVAIKVGYVFLLFSSIISIGSVGSDMLRPGDWHSDDG